MKMIKAAIIVIIAACLQTAGAYSSGAPTSVCTSMSPTGTGMTGAAAQSSQSPYILNISLPTFNAGEILLGCCTSL